MQNNDFTMISPWNMWILHWNIEIVTMENRDLLVPITIEELSSKKRKQCKYLLVHPIE
jgi:hypothetical protein